MRLFIVVVISVAILMSVRCGREEQYNANKFVGMKVNGGLLSASAVNKAEAEGRQVRIVNQDGEALELDNSIVPGRLGFTVNGGKVTAVEVEGEPAPPPREGPGFVAGIWIGFLGLFAFGSLAWWFVSAGMIIFLFCQIERDNEGLIGSVIGAVIYVAFLEFMCDVPVIGYIRQDPLWIPVYILGFMGIGLIWSFIKWKIFCSKADENYAKCRQEFLRRSGDADATLDSRIPVELKEKWIFDGLKPNKPYFAKNKARITMWVMWWPLSLVWTFFDDFIKNVIRSFVQAFKGIYDSIARRNLKRFTEDE